MNVSELIAELQKVMAEEGDLPVHVYGCDCETAEPVAEVYVSIQRYMVIVPW